MPRLQLHRIGLDEYSWLLDDFDCRDTLEVAGGTIAIGHHADIGEVAFGLVNGEAFVVEIDHLPARRTEAAS